MKNKKHLYAPLWYNGLSLFVLLFGMIYTHFGHGVTSDHMTYAFLPTLLCGFVYLILAAAQRIPRPDRFSATFLSFSVAAFTLNSISKGIMEIAGAYSNYDGILYIAAIACLATAFILYPIEIVLKKKQQ